MKTKLLLLIICTCALFKVQAQEVQRWEYVCSLSCEQLRKVCTQGPDTVYVVGKNGLIAMSADKGITWDNRYLAGKEALNDVIFYNHEIGFIVGDNGTILRTQDAGSSWEQLTSGTSLNINAIAVFDLNNIWVIGCTWNMSVGYSNIIMHSADMGETWIVKPLLSDNLYLSDIKCKGNKGYITGLSGYNGIMLKTEDEGTTWKEQVLTGYYGTHSLSITDSNVYALAGKNIIFTEDNINWHTLSEFSRESTAIYFQDDQTGFIASYDITTCGDCGMVFWIFKTTDSGNTWEELHFKYFQKGNSTISNFAFSPNNEFGYCVFGHYLIRTPYTGEFEHCKNNDCTPACTGCVGINAIQTENPIQINHKGNELQVNSYSKMIAGVEIRSIDGIKIMRKTEQGEIINLNVSNLPKGIYVINVLFTDKTSYFGKWIKN